MSFPYHGSCVRKKFRYACDYCNTIFDGFHHMQNYDLHFCKRECVTKSRKLGGKISNKTRATNTKRRGVPIPAQDKSVRDKMEQTMLDRHGVRNSSQLIEVIEKRRRTSITNWGVSHPMKSSAFIEIRDNKHEAKYGVQNPAQRVEVIEKMQKTCIERFGYDNPLKSPEIAARVRQTNENSGLWQSLEQKSEYERYYTQVWKFTKQQMTYKCNTRRLKSRGLSIDHIFSIIDGFEQGIAPVIVGHESNLRVISQSENSSKWRRSHKTLEQLYEDYERSKKL